MQDRETDAELSPMMLHACHPTISTGTRQPGAALGQLTVGLPLDHGGQQSEAELDLLLPREHLIVQQDGEHAVDRGGDALGEVEAGEALATLRIHLTRHGEHHAVALPLQTVLNAHLLEQLQTERCKDDAVSRGRGMKSHPDLTKTL